MTQGKRTFQAVIEADDGDELWVDDAVETDSRAKARVAARRMLRGQPADGITYRAFVYEGTMVNHGDEEWPDLVFEADYRIEAEAIHA